MGGPDEHEGLSPIVRSYSRMCTNPNPTESSFGIRSLLVACRRYEGDDRPSRQQQQRSTRFGVPLSPARIFKEQRKTVL